MCPFLVPVVADRLWLYPVGCYCRRPDGRPRVPARSTLLRLCTMPSYRSCGGYLAASAPVSCPPGQGADTMNPRLVELLAREGIQPTTIDHRDVFTAQERAAVSHISGHRLAKVLVVHDDADDWNALVVIPAAARLDLFLLSELTGRRLRLAREGEIVRLTTDCEVGALPPFGRLYGGLAVFLDERLARGESLVFAGGSHHQEVRISMRDYLRIERPDVVSLTAERQAA